MIRALIFDLDNTLLRMDKSVSPYTRDVLRRCREAGIHIFAASARPERTVREFGILGEFEALVTLNGARMLLPGRVLTSPMPRKTGEAVISRLISIPGAVISVETGGGIFSSRPVPAWNAAVFGGFPKLPEGELYKILVSGVGEGDVRSALTPDTYFTAIEGGKLYQIMDKTASKWNGLRKLLEEFCIHPCECAYFGDDFDDIQCVKNCGLGVAMGNAIDEVKAVADVTAGHCDGDGAARFIEKEILLCSSQ